MAMKMRLKTENKSQRYNINRPRHGYRHWTCITEHLGIILSSFHEKSNEGSANRCNYVYRTNQRKMSKQGP